MKLFSGIHSSSGRKGNPEPGYGSAVVLHPVLDHCFPG